MQLPYIEDLYNLGDQDYNDMIFTFSGVPFSAIDLSHIPSGVPAPGVAATVIIALGVMGVARIKDRRRKQIRET